MRRGRTLFFQERNKDNIQKAMVCELTSKKEHVRVATDGQMKSVVIALNEVRTPPPQPLDGQVFVISGNIAERGDKKKLNTDDLTRIILKNGGNVYTGNIEKAVDADYVLITSQKEVEKDHLKVNKAIAMAHRFGWPIISKKFVIESDGRDEHPDINAYKLNLSKTKQDHKIVWVKHLLLELILLLM